MKKETPAWIPVAIAGAICFALGFVVMFLMKREGLT